MGQDVGSRAARRVLVGALAGATVLAVAAARPRGGRGRLIDWENVIRLARARLDPAQDPSPAEAASTVLLYRRLAGEVKEPLLKALGGLPAGVELPEFDVLGRRSWVDLNVGILRRTLEPLLEGRAVEVPNSLLVDWGRAGLDRYLALLLGYLAGRVLGQFDPKLLGKEPIPAHGGPGLYLVEPNVAAWERRDGLPADQLRRWLILHEMTHAWQFAAHPWLRDHLNSLLEEVLALAAAPGDRWSRILAMTVGLRRQWQVARRMQATMSLVEGYGNLAMNLVGRQVLPDFEALESAYRQRSEHRGPLEVLFFKVTGLDMKMQQYEIGEDFARRIYEAHGMEALNRAWEGPRTLPTLDELRDAEAWYRRVSRL